MVNRGYWSPKLERNVERDRDTDAALEAAGWTVLQYWEHELPEQVAASMAHAVAAASSR